MKPAAMASDVGFPDPKLPPQPAELVDVIGVGAYAHVAKLNAWLDATYPAVTREWKFSNTSGWLQIASVKKRRLFYFIPKRGDFRLNMILGDKAIGSLAKGPHARQMASLLKAAKRYPEGTGFFFDRASLNADVAIAMVSAKLEN